MPTNVNHHVTNYNAATTPIGGVVPVKVSSERYPSRGRLDLTIWNVGAVGLYGSNDPAVAVSGARRGIPIAAGQVFSDDKTTGDFYLIAEAGTGADCIVDEVY
jgi:hypothetical protein